MGRYELETIKANKNYERYSDIIDAILTLDDEDIEKVENLFPRKLKDYSKIDYSEADYFNIIAGLIDHIEYIPKVNEFYGVLLLEDGTRHLATFGYMLNLIKTNELEFEVVAINPNLYRVAKCIYGSSIGDVVSELGNWFVDHLLDTHTNIYKKNSGVDFREDKLTKEELEASSDWLDELFQEEIHLAFKLYVDSQNYALSDIEINKRIISLYKMIDLIQNIEECKSEIYGYGLSKDKVNYEYLEVIDLINNHFQTENVTSLIDNLKREMNKEDISYNVLRLCYNNCFTNNLNRIIEGALAELYYGVIKVEEDLNVPGIDLCKRMQCTNKSLAEISSRYKLAKQEIPIIVDRVGVREWANHFAGDVYIEPVGTKEYKVYNDMKRYFNTYTNALYLKSQISPIKVLEMLVELKNLNVEDSLLYEAAVISATQREGLFNNSQLPNPYYVWFRQEKKSIKDALRR